MLRLAFLSLLAVSLSAQTITATLTGAVHDPQGAAVFLRGAAVLENFIAFMKSLTRVALEFHSVFILYSTKDQEFAGLKARNGAEAARDSRRFSRTCRS